jgi:cardiolipin synthase
MDEVLTGYWPHVVFILTTVISALAVVDAAMTKRDVRAAIAWVGVIMFSPLFGALLYFLAGVNRIRKEKVLQQLDDAVLYEELRDKLLVHDVVGFSGAQFAAQKRLGDSISRFRLLGQNRVLVLSNGDEAYAAMLNAIGGAQHTIALQSYIFDHDEIGLQIAQALIEAKNRGVEVRVLIDSVGSKYSRPPITHFLETAGVKTALFMTTFFGLRLAYANLRSHRKVMIVDGVLGLTGGMNIRKDFSSVIMKDQVMHDTHFELHGPVVHQLMLSFAHDWAFTTKESLRGVQWFPVNEAVIPKTGVPVRCVPSGPDSTLSNNRDILLGALSVAQHNVRIQSPYFLPDLQLIAALSTAARRGVQVDILIPGHNNLKTVSAAMDAQLNQVLETGCRVWRSYGAFDHSKLFTVDGAWSYVGSSNLDSRSLRLNFELDLEVFDRELAQSLESRIDAVITRSTQVTLEQLVAQPFWLRLRNKLAWLASPYL